jgi:hypothetical protein
MQPCGRHQVIRERQLGGRPGRTPAHGTNMPPSARQRLCQKRPSPLGSILDLTHELDSTANVSLQLVRTFSTTSRARSARRARGWQPGSDRRHPTQALASMRRSSRPATGRCSPGEPFARRAPRAALRPFGPRRRRRAPGPGTGRSWRAAAEPAPGARPAKAAILPAIQH